jgi:hypothetical protein
MSSVYEIRQPQQLLREITDYGATSVPLLDEPVLSSLGEAAEGLPFEQTARTVGDYDVRQELEVCRAVPEEGIFGQVHRQLEDRLNEAFGLADPHPWTDEEMRRLCFNEAALQRYPAGSLGLSPHRDGKRYRVLIAILVISGEGTFAVCDDRAGTNPHPIAAAPGDCILLRAPGFRGIEKRPFHYVSDVTKERLVLTLRHDSRRAQPGI